MTNEESIDYFEKDYQIKYDKWANAKNLFKDAEEMENNDEAVWENIKKSIQEIAEEYNGQFPES